MLDLEDLEIPDEWLNPVVKGLRQNLERAVDLETEVDGYPLWNIAPIIPGDPAGGYFGRTSGLSASIIAFSQYFERLSNVDVEAAMHELAAWPTDDDTIFGRLRIWACGISELVPEGTCTTIIAGLSNKCFWHSSHQRDLLLVLAKRWANLSSSARGEIERRILDGPAKWQHEAQNEFEERKARVSLDRLTWLASHGCELSIGVWAEMEELRHRAPEWKPEYASHAADSREIHGGAVRTDTEHSPLLRVPLSSVLSRAIELSGRTENFLVEKDPFSGLCAKRPARALAVLTYEAKRKEYPEWAWHTFLTSEARHYDKPKFSTLIAERLSQYPDAAVATIIDSISDWILGVAEKLVTSSPEAFDKVTSKLIKNHPLSRDNYGEVFGGIVLAVGAAGMPRRGNVSNGELRDVLLCGDDDFRSFILWQVERWSQSTDSRTAETWSRLLLEFLRDVWPRQNRKWNAR
jgi:hypothetical protein